jgi:hypothetical protein
MVQRFSFEQFIGTGCNKKQSEEWRTGLSGQLAAAEEFMAAMVLFVWIGTGAAVLSSNFFTVLGDGVECVPRRVTLVE